MKVFNPEKELYKIQHGNKNRIIFGVIALLIIIGISSSYALYQVRYSKRIIYTKVAPFSTHDLDLAISVDGTIDTLPTKGTAYYNGITCENDKSATASWDYDNWKLNSIYTTIPNKCNIDFTKQKPLLIEKIKSINGENSDLVVDDETGDNNLRYVGADPSNYIWFNCNDYNNLTQTTAAAKCEKWRIIGLMNNITKVDEKTNVETTNQSLVKIIRTDSIGYLAWDTASGNNWEKASLQKSLNGVYLSEEDKGEWITNNKDLNYKSLTDATQEIIENVKWNLGATDDFGTSSVLMFYNNERMNKAYNNQPTIWNGKIAIMYLSDYGYATSGGTKYNRDACLDYALYNWGSTGYREDCVDNDWLYHSASVHQWFLDPQLTSSWVLTVHKPTEYIVGNDTPSFQFQIRPSLYLKSTVKILSGTGSEDEPYIIV